MTDTFRAVYPIIDPHKRLHTFEVNFFKCDPNRFLDMILCWIATLGFI